MKDAISHSVIQKNNSITFHFIPKIRTAKTHTTISKLNNHLLTFFYRKISLSLLNRMTNIFSRNVLVNKNLVVSIKYDENESSEGYEIDIYL